MDKLIRLFGLREPLIDVITHGIPVLATCAGMILVATELEDAIKGQQTLGVLDVTVRRNAFGSQRESFDAVLEVKGWDQPVDVSFIRAPIVTRVGDGVTELATLPDGRVVAVRQGAITALAFHPEVTGETRFHHEFLHHVQEYSAGQG
jgi:5'-phosphate synthase pdxT subunit